MKMHASRTLIDQGCGLKFTESPRWHDGKLWFLGIHDKRIKTADLGGRLETAVELPFVPNARRSTAGMARRCSPWPTSPTSRCSD